MNARWDRRAALVCALALVLTACGDAETTNNTTNNTSAGPQRLACASMAWCATMASSREAPQDVPALTGGTITPGVYRLEEGALDQLAIKLTATRALAMHGGSEYNEEGQWSAQGDTLTISLTRYCDAEDPQRDDWDNTTRYTFAVRGDDLFLKEIGCEGLGCLLRLRRVTDLCAESASFTCASGLCSCSVREGAGFPSCS